MNVVKIIRIFILTMRLNLGDRILTSELVEINAVYCMMEGSTTMLYFLFIFCICIFILYFILHNVNIFTMEGFSTILYVLFMFCICILYFVSHSGNLLPCALVECVLDISTLVSLYDANQQGQEKNQATHL